MCRKKKNFITLKASQDQGQHVNYNCNKDKKQVFSSTKLKRKKNKLKPINFTKKKNGEEKENTDTFVKLLKQSRTDGTYILFFKKKDTQEV